MQELATMPIKLATLGTAKIGGLVCNKNCAVSLGDELPDEAFFESMAESVPETEDDSQR